MRGLLEEIKEIPEVAQVCYRNNGKIRLPTKVPYLGMGSSYFAALTLLYCGKDINPQIASEYYTYLAKAAKPVGVLISQSGESSETLWNLEKFRKVVAITNNTGSPLAVSSKTSKVVALHAGEERYSSTKTYINTLVVLYLGLSIDPLPAITFLQTNFEEINAAAERDAGAIFDHMKLHHPKGYYVLGSGPNIGTAYEGALTLSETTKLPWCGLPIAQYDHGTKEAGEKSILLTCNGYTHNKRIGLIENTFSRESKPLVIRLGEPSVAEALSPLIYILHLNLIMNYLADHLRVGDTFRFGGKVTRVN